MGAMSRAHADEALRRECLDRFAHHATSDTETSFQILLRRQRIADRE